jgi:hypothetical protein
MQCMQEESKSSQKCEEIVNVIDKKVQMSKALSSTVALFCLVISISKEQSRG